MNKFKHRSRGRALRASVAAQDANPAYDAVIGDGRVLDGAGNRSLAADVALRSTTLAPRVIQFALKLNL